MPTLLKMLEDKRVRQDQATRVKRVKALLMELKRQFHPFQAMMDELDIWPPSPSCTLDNPFPDMTTLLQWDCIEGLFATAIPRANLEQEFNSRKPTIKKKISEWRTEAEITLASLFPDDRKNIVEVSS